MLVLIGRALQMSKDVLILIILTSFTLCVFFGCILYTVEKGTFIVSENFPSGYYVVPTVNQYSTQQSLFQSAMTGMYVAIITLMTGENIVCFVNIIVFIFIYIKSISVTLILTFLHFSLYVSM